jgi:hypothetical protein
MAMMVKMMRMTRTLSLPSRRRRNSMMPIWRIGDG